jgi:hypothetical protein
MPRERHCAVGKGPFDSPIVPDTPNMFTGRAICDSRISVSARNTTLKIEDGDTYAMHSLLHDQEGKIFCRAVLRHIACGAGDGKLLVRDSKALPTDQNDVQGTQFRVKSLHMVGEEQVLSCTDDITARVMELPTLCDFFAQKPPFHIFCFKCITTVRSQQ